MTEGLVGFAKSVMELKDTKTDLEKLIDAAKKQLGTKAVFPKMNFDPAKVAADISKSVKTLKAESAEMRKALLERENRAIEALNNIQAYQRQLAKSDFGLDTKDKAMTKKIDEAHKIFDEYFKPVVASWTETIAHVKQTSADMSHVYD